MNDGEEEAGIEDYDSWTRQPFSSKPFKIKASLYY